MSTETEITILFDSEQPHFNGKRLYIRDVIPLNNEKLSTTYENKKISMNTPNEKLLYHGTPNIYESRFVENGYELSRKKSMPGRIGDGLYLSTLATQSVHYTMKYDYKMDETEFTLFVCKVLTGRSYCGGSPDCNLKRGYDSHHIDYAASYGVDKRDGYEYCIFKPNQVLPYVILKLTTNCI